MKPFTLVLVAAATSAAVSALVSALLAPSSARADASSGLASEVERVAQAVARLGERTDALERGLDEARSERVVPAAAPARVAVGEIEAAVARWMEEHGPAAGAPVAAAAEPPGRTAGYDARALTDMLFDDALPFVEREELWQALREEGRLDEVIAEMERRAELDASNPDLRVQLGYAYLQKIQEVGNTPLAGVWATKADRAFDQALELDPGHWDARYTKAVALSHWPAFLGKRPQAIHELETLVSTQEQKPPQPKYASTYLVLGNLYLESGDEEQAIAVWEKGLALYPDAEDIAAQLALVQ